MAPREKQDMHPKKEEGLIKLNICEKSKLSNSAATGKTHFWLIRKAFFNSLNCQVFSVACHWMLMVVPQVYRYWLRAEITPRDIPQAKWMRFSSGRKLPAVHYGRGMRRIV